ncbi:cell division protein ZapE [Pseudokineococcus basanitobsidens]|uniref:Cell division protein ZapE n=1 Tax=Pseudokineococcus basanitobsidens TaxID=1926649 RepID=A0ABU8RHL8_9ACTN
MAATSSTERSDRGGVGSLVGRVPELGRDRLVAELVPSPRFADVSFASYEPSPSEPTQARAVTELEAHAERVRAAQDARGAKERRGLRRLLGGRSPEPSGAPGVYLDGGFGVGKTHLLAATWHAVPGPKAFGTFVEYTNLVGALGFAEAVRALQPMTLVAIDEFELDDPGDTVLMARLLRELVDAGVRLAATSNTLPGSLGEGRFAADDFLREIQAVGSNFEVVRIEGEDYRHRGMPDPPAPLADDALEERARAVGDGAVLDDFGALTEHLARVHPSRYGALLDGVTDVFWRDVRPLADQNVALRAVVLADRMYDRSLPLTVSGSGLSELFTPEMLGGGYRKKYYRALSRLTSLAREGA